MTILGKMLVFLVLVLSVVWNGLVVNAYATRSNWRAEVKKYQDKAVEAAESANSQSKLVAVERDAAEDRTRALREERDRLYAQVSEAQKQLATLTRAYNDKLAAEQARGGDEAKLQANNATLVKQVDDLTKSLSEKEAGLNRLNLEAERSKAAEVKAQLEAASFQQRYERLNEVIQNERERMRTQQSGGDTADRRAEAPTGFRGTIRSRQGDLVSFTPGADVSGLQVGARLTAYRLSPAPKYLGTVVVVSLNPKDGVGRFTPATNRRAGPDDYPREGDELKPN